MRSTTNKICNWVSTVNLTSNYRGVPRRETDFPPFVSQEAIVYRDKEEKEHTLFRVSLGGKGTTDKKYKEHRRTIRGAKTKSSTITIMIIITTMTTMTKTMIRSFPSASDNLVSGWARQLVGARTSIQLILYLPNYTILFLIGRPFDHPNENRNPIRRILFHATGRILLRSRSRDSFTNEAFDVS